MKKGILLSLFVLSFLTVEAQQVLPNGQRMRQRVVNRTPGTTSAQRNPEFNVEKAIGLTIYDIERITKKVGIKKSNDNYNKVEKIFKDFNKEMNQVKRINGFLLSQAKSKVESAQTQVLETREYSILEKAYKEVSEGFKPITAEIKTQEEGLDKKLKEVLSDKQFKKWKKLQTKMKRKG